MKSSKLKQIKKQTPTPMVALGRDDYEQIIEWAKRSPNEQYCIISGCRDKDGKIYPKILTTDEDFLADTSSTGATVRHMPIYAAITESEYDVHILMHTHPRLTGKDTDEGVDVADVKHMHAILEGAPNGEILFGVTSYDQMSFWAGDLKTKSASQIQFTVDGEPAGVRDIVANDKSKVEMLGRVDRLISRVSAAFATIMAGVTALHLTPVIEKAGTVAEKFDILSNCINQQSVVGGACFAAFAAIAVIKKALIKTPAEYTADSAPYMCSEQIRGV
jgi:hypothetical protein